MAHKVLFDQDTDGDDITTYMAFEMDATFEISAGRRDDGMVYLVITQLDPYDLPPRGAKRSLLRAGFVETAG